MWGQAYDLELYPTSNILVSKEYHVTKNDACCMLHIHCTRINSFFCLFLKNKLHNLKKNKNNFFLLSLLLLLLLLLFSLTLPRHPPFLEFIIVVKLKCSSKGVSSAYIVRIKFQRGAQGGRGGRRLGRNRALLHHPSWVYVRVYVHL
jgi:hypothetical protein